MADTYWSYVELLCHFDGDDDSTTFEDVSDNAFAMSNDSTGAKLDTAQYKFGTSSLLVDGNDYVKLGGQSEFAFGTGDFTVEFWVRFNSTAGQQFLYDSTPYSTTGNYLHIAKQSDSTIAVFYDADYSEIITSSVTVSTGTWYHIAVSRTSNDIKLFINGTQSGSTYTTSINFSNGSDRPLIGGRGFYPLSNGLNGWIDEIRVTKGIGRYTSNFTAPTEAFPDEQPIDLVSATSTQKQASSTAALVAFLESSIATQANQSNADPLSVEKYLTTTTVSVQTNQSGTGILGLLFSLPISIENYYRVSIGIPIIIRVKSTATLPTLPITAGTYPVTTTLPIVFRLRSTPTLPTLPVVIYGNESAAAGTGPAVAAAASWKPKCLINGVDMTAKLIGGGSVEFDEMAAPVASFSLLPAAGTVDPLAYVGQSVQLMLQFLEAGAVVAEYLVFTGLVSDPTWSVDDRVLTISATGDLQSQFDTMTKAQVSTQLASVSPTYSEVVFGDQDDLSGWEFAEALLSTVNAIVWQDSGGVIRVTSTLPKVSADFTYQDDGRFIGADISYPSRLDLINKRTIEVGYRFSRLRSREVDVSFRPWQLITPEVWLSCEGGWDLPQRSQIESAASGSGWYPTTDIRYAEVWPNGLYTTRSCAGVNFMAGLLIEDAVREDLCVGANWTAARRWNQTVTETATITVGASESQAVVGVLADNESYAYESEYENEDWEDSLEDEDYSTSGMTQMASGDWKLDLDTDRTDFEAAQTVAVAKARCDILKSHRGTTVTIQTTYQPQLDLSHTIEIDCAFVHCQGKVRRITHAWDIDTGDLTSEIAVALYRHNGAGLVSDTAVAATTKAVDPDETAPATILQLPMYIGGRDDKPPYDETWTGYIVNMPTYESASTDPVDRAQVWARSPDNPAVQTYPEGFHMVYPTIDATYADPGNAAATADFEVAVPEDLLELTA